jgi:hypothetical protein
MGCDIHLHIEIKIAGQWQHYGCPDVPRSYHLFGKLAGVRDKSVEPIARLRGLPGDITLVTYCDYFGTPNSDSAPAPRDNWHNQSWINRNEIKQLADWLDEEGGFAEEIDLEHHILHSYLFNNAFSGSSEFTDGGGIVEDVRFVFWFDN